MINYIGPGGGNGIRIYHDGVQVANDTRRARRGPCPDGICLLDGNIVLGRVRVRDEDYYYCSFQVDELALFNDPLSEEEIVMLSQHFDNK